MKTTHFIIATSAVLSLALSRLNKATKNNLDINELVSFALLSVTNPKEDLESLIFDRVYFRHQDDSVLAPLFTEGSNEECRIAYNVLTERINKLTRTLRKLGKVLKLEINKHIEFGTLPRNKTLYGVDANNDLIISVRSFEEDE